MRIVYMGTPDFAVGPLKALYEAGHTICAVVTQPDKPKGRGGKVSMTPVKEWALSHEIPVLQPRRIKTPEAIEELKQYPADVFVVAAFGQILSQEILDMPPYGCINIHASLLPAYRGAAPIQWAIINGEEYSGVTIMQMDAGLDTGDMLLQKKIPITEEETGESLFDKLAVLGSEMIVEALEKLAAGELTKTPQGSEFTYAKMMDKTLGELDFSRPAVELERLIRGLNPWPSAYTHRNGRLLKIWKAKAVSETCTQAPGTIVAVDKQSATVACGSGALVLLELQPEGKKMMPVKDYLLGNPFKVGEILQ